jgi:hypothetical protein
MKLQKYAFILELGAAMNRNSSNPCGTIALEYNRQTI